MKIFKMVSIALLVASVIVLGINQHQMSSELDRYKALAHMTSSQMAHTQMMMETFWEMSGEEIDRRIEDAIRRELDGSVEISQETTTE